MKPSVLGLKNNREVKKMGGEAKKKLKKLICAGIVTLALAEGYREVRAESHENYFPLNVGNSWTYIDCNEGSTKTFTIIGTEEINGHTYYKFDDYVRVCGFPGCDSEPCVPEDTDMLFRYEPNTDKVLQYRSSTNEDLVRYDFSGNMWPDGYGNQLIETGISCTVPAGQFDNCCIFEFAMTVDCGEFYETLAPGVGNIRHEAITFNENFELQSYTILPYCGDPNHPYPVGDLNQDCRVDLLDLAILATHWLERVNLEPVVYITEPEDGDDVVPYMDSVCITAEASDVDGSVVKVEFFIDGIKFAEENDEYIDGVAGWTACTSFDEGTYILTVKATDNDGATTTSPAVTITAGRNTCPEVYITQPEDGDVVVPAMDSIRITANAWDVDGSVVKVEFFINGIKFAEENDEYIDGVAGWTAYTAFDPGTYILTAKATDNDGATTSSLPVTITATEFPPSGG